MSQEAVERVLGRLLTDDDFRKRALMGLAAACRAEGYPLTEEELSAIKPQDLQCMDTLAVVLDPSIKRFCRCQGGMKGKERSAKPGK